MARTRAMAWARAMGYSCAILHQNTNMLISNTIVVLDENMDTDSSSAFTNKDKDEVISLKNWTYKAKPGAKNNTSPDTDDYNVWCVEHLRKECMARGFHLERSVSKDNRIKRLMAQDEMRDKLMEQNIQDDSLLTPEVVGTVRTRHCLFRLLNVLFNNKHITDFMKLGKSHYVLLFVCSFTLTNYYSCPSSCSCLLLLLGDSLG